MLIVLETFTPNQTGTFEMVLSNGSGNCLNSDTMYANVKPLPIVTVGLDTTVCANEKQFNLSANQADGIWVGNGIIDASLGTFDPNSADPGTHVIVYTFTDPATTCSNSDTLLVNVRGIPTADFEYEPETCADNSETYTNLSLQASQYYWNFDDGGTSSLFSPQHTYTTTGFFQH